MERKWWTLLTSCIAIFMLPLDVTIVNVALPSIERGLGRLRGGVCAGAAAGLRGRRRPDAGSAGAGADVG